LPDETNVQRILNLLRTDKYVQYCDELATRIDCVIKDNFAKAKIKETTMIRDITEKTNGISGNCGTLGSFGTNAFNIHGTRAQVRFEYRDGAICKEIADLLMIVTVVDDKVKVFEKATFVQMKRAESIDTPSKWVIDREQLHFLSRLPVFDKAIGSVPNAAPKKHLLTSFSNNLGLYGLLYPKGGYYVSAPKILSVLCSRKNSGKTRIVEDALKECCRQSDMNCSAIVNKRKSEDAIIKRMNLRNDYLFYREPFGNFHYSMSTKCFIERFVALSVGETIFSIFSDSNEGLKDFLYGLLEALKEKLSKSGKQVTPQIKAFNDLLNTPFAQVRSRIPPLNLEDFIVDDYDSEGIGVIQVVLNLGLQD